MITCAVRCSSFPFTVGLLYQQDTELGVRTCLPPALLYNVSSYSKRRLLPLIAKDSIKIYFIIQLRTSWHHSSESLKWRCSNEGRIKAKTFHRAMEMLSSSLDSWSLRSIRMIVWCYVCLQLLPSFILNEPFL